MKAAFYAVTFVVGSIGMSLVLLAMCALIVIPWLSGRL